MGCFKLLEGYINGRDSVTQLSLSAIKSQICQVNCIDRPLARLELKKKKERKKVECFVMLLQPC